MKITVDVASLVIGLIIGGIIIWITLKSTRPKQIDEPPRRDILVDFFKPEISKCSADFSKYVLRYNDVNFLVLCSLDDFGG